MRLPVDPHALRVWLAIAAGLLAVVASFLFLGLGTVAALTREFWHHHEHKMERK